MKMVNGRVVGLMDHRSGRSSTKTSANATTLNSSKEESSGSASKTSSRSSNTFTLQIRFQISKQTDSQDPIVCVRVKSERLYKSISFNTDTVSMHVSRIA